MTPFIATENSITVLVKGQSFTVNATHPNFLLLKDALVNGGDEDEISNLVSISKAVNTFMDGSVEVRGGAVFYNGEEIHGTVVDRILNFMSEGLPFQPLVNFIKRLALNPSRRAVNELYTFLEHKSLPITPDGTFLAYKAIQNDWMSKTSGNNGKIRNSIGDTPTVARNEVCDDADVGCSFGLHAGSLEYVQGFRSGNDRIVIVEIDPADVISILKDCECMKLRTCRYYVVQEYVGEMTQPLYEVDRSTNSATPTAANRDKYGRFSKGGRVKPLRFHNKRDASGQFVS